MEGSNPGVGITPKPQNPALIDCLLIYLNVLIDNKNGGLKNFEYLEF